MSRRYRSTYTFGEGVHTFFFSTNISDGSKRFLTRRLQNHVELGLYEISVERMIKSGIGVSQTSTDLDAIKCREHYEDIVQKSVSKLILKSLGKTVDVISCLLVMSFVALIAETQYGLTNHSRKRMKKASIVF